MHDDLALELIQRYDSPPERVYAAWSNPDRVITWWGPAQFTATRYEADVRPEGRWYATIVGPDGKSLDQSGTFTSVEPNRRLAFSFRWGEAEAIESHIIVDFTQDGDGTIVTFCQSPFGSTEDRDSHAEGWRECLARSERAVENANA